jgi:copper(I)-binding protein
VPALTCEPEAHQHSDLDLLVVVLRIKASAQVALIVTGYHIMNFNIKDNFKRIFNPSSPVADTSKDTKEKILAFRSITTFLAQTQQRSLAFDDTTSSKASQEERQELKILTALATIMVTDNEVVAVVANHGDAERTTLDVLAYTSNGNQPTPEPPSSSFWKCQQEWKLFVNMNPRHDQTPNLGDIPIILDPEVPDDLKAQPDDQDLLKKHLNERRCVNCSNVVPQCMLIPI